MLLASLAASAALACSPAAAQHAAASLVAANGFHGVDTVICHDVTGDRRTDMVVTFASGGTAGDVAWAVWRATPAGWRLAFAQLHAYQMRLALSGNDLVEIQPIYRKQDPNCCPTGGLEHRRFRWNGRTFTVARSWHTAAP